MRPVLTDWPAGIALTAVGMACSVAAHAGSVIQSCTVSATAVPFGVYNPMSLSVLNGSGTVTLTCSVLSLLSSWTIYLSTGNSTSFASRLLKSGTNSLTYNLFTTASHTTVWGDGTAGTGYVSDTELISIGNTTFNYPVYGQLAAMQDKPPGIYADSITVTVNY